MKMQSTASYPMWRRCGEDVAKKGREKEKTKNTLAPSKEPQCQHESTPFRSGLLSQPHSLALLRVPHEPPSLVSCGLPVWDGTYLRTEYSTYSSCRVLVLPWRALNSGFSFVPAIAARVPGAGSKQ
jgi:hypothetical protein